MSGLVVYASVIVKWLVAESGSEQAARLLEDGRTLIAPELLFAEAGNALWALCRRGDITPQVAGQGHTDHGCDAAPIEGVALHHDHRAPQARSRSVRPGQFSPPYVALCYQSLSASRRRAAATMNSSLAWPSPSTT